MRVTKQTVVLIFGGIALFNLVFGVAALFLRRGDAVDSRLGHEALALARLGDAHALFYTPASHGDLAAARPDLTAPEAERGFAQGVQMPSVFRALDHERHFDAVLLYGDPTTYEPLLRHLGETRDFVLTWLDNATLIFRRAGARPWTEGDLDATAGLFKGENRARFLAGAATRLIAMEQFPMARRALDAAAADGGRAPEYWTALALYDGQVAHWPEALDAVNRALALDATFTPALTTKANILYGAERYDEALAITDEVVARYPDDPSMLFLHATISHQAHAYDREIAALTHLIQLGEAQGISTTGYRIYLGQALAETGQAMASLAQFQQALGEPDISPEQRKFAQDCVDKIHAKTDPGK